MRCVLKGCAVVFAMSLSLAGTLCAARPKLSSEKLIRALADVNFGEVYYDDGAADGSVTDKQWITQLAGKAAFASVQSILDLKDRAIPLLIEHVDDQRPTRIMFNGNPVPLGHVAMDILTHIIGTNDCVFIADCADDGLGACIEPAYYFRPDAKSSEMRKVKMNWRRLYASGVLKFEPPMDFEASVSAYSGLV